MTNTISTKQGLLALSPLFVFLALYLGLSIVCNDFYAVPITVAFLAACIWSLVIAPGATFGERFAHHYKGTASSGIMQMIWIFILAGAFAATAKQTGAIQAAVALALHAIPASFILGSLFIAACFISLSCGTSVGTIAALVPIASNMAEQTDASAATLVAVVVGGAYFGDNLSFISDTTIMATQTQGCGMKEKFRANLWIALPAACICLLIYALLPTASVTTSDVDAISYLSVIPYLYIIVAALLGMDVMLVLTTATLLAAGLGMACGTLGGFEWLKVMNEGIMGMSELIIVTLLAAGMMQVIRAAGGIDWLLQVFSRHIRSSRGAELSMAALVCITDFCTANNTIAILSVGPLSRQLAERYGIAPRRAASILDTFSCTAQGIIPYGAQMLIACGLASLSPLDIIPHLYYPFALGAVALLYIFFKRSVHATHP